MNNCIHCGIGRPGHASKYCSNRCQADHRYSEYLARWRKGKESGLRGTTTFNLSAHIIRYIQEKYNGQCARCGWGEPNPITKRAALEIDHIDGDAENNRESNLTLLCPNCHSLTPNYKNLNKGRGRLWRREKYVKIVETPL